MSPYRYGRGARFRLEASWGVLVLGRAAHRGQQLSTDPILAMPDRERRRLSTLRAMCEAHGWCLVCTDAGKGGAPDPGLLGGSQGV